MAVSPFGRNLRVVTVYGCCDIVLCLVGSSANRSWNTKVGFVLQIGKVALMFYGNNCPQPLAHLCWLEIYSIFTVIAEGGFLDVVCSCLS